MAVDSTLQFVMGDWELGKNFSRNGMCSNTLASAKETPP